MFIDVGQANVYAEFKSWLWLFIFTFVIMTSWKEWIQIYFPNYGLNRVVW